MSLPESSADNPFAHHQSAAAPTSDPWLPGLAKALLWLQWAFVLSLFNLVALVLLIFVLSWSLEAAQAALLLPGAFVWGLNIAGCWLLSRQEDGITPARWSLSWLLWWSLITQAAVTLVITFVTQVVIPAGPPPAGPGVPTTALIVSSVLMLVVLLLSLAWYVSLFLRLSEIARRLGDEPLARFAVRRLWWVLGLSTLGVLLVGLGPLIAILMTVSLLRMVRSVVLAAERSGPAVSAG
jgi:magnesium-transporting ATPase (P-type)